MTDKYKQYTEVSYCGTELLKKHSLDEEGIWHVKGEDLNCDFGGHHHNPDLGVFQGKLRDVIATVVELPNFWSWGGGGPIEKITIKQADAAAMKRRNELIVRRNALQEELNRINKELE